MTKPHKTPEISSGSKIKSLVVRTGNCFFKNLSQLKIYILGPQFIRNEENNLLNIFCSFSACTSIFLSVSAKSKFVFHFQFAQQVMSDPRHFSIWLTTTICLLHFPARFPTSFSYGGGF